MIFQESFARDCHPGFIFFKESKFAFFLQTFLGYFQIETFNATFSHAVESLADNMLFVVWTNSNLLLILMLADSIVSNEGLTLRCLLNMPCYFGSRIKAH